MPVDPVTRQQLLELVYDLLAEAEAVELRARIESDAEVAAAYAEARRTAGVLADAARLEAPKVDYRRLPRAHVSREAARGRSPRMRSSPWARGANWAVSLAATVLLAFSLGGYLYHRQELADLAASHMRLLVTGPAQLQAGITNTYQIAASTVTGTPLATKVELALYAPGGKPLLRQEEDTDTRGHARLIVPADLNLPSAVRLEVSAAYKDKRETLTTDMPVARERYAAHLALDRSHYRPGETVRARAVVLSRAKLSADRDLPVRISIVDGARRTLSGFPLELPTQHGVAQTEWHIPASADGPHTVVIQSPTGLFAPRRQAFEVRAEERAELAKQLEFSRPAYRAGETVVAYFSARRRDGRPAGGVRLTIAATLDGTRFYQASPAPLGDGPLAIRFPLPPVLASGDARLSITVVDAGRSETIVRAIPLTPVRPNVCFRPEGGALVAGLRNRVYFTATDRSGKPLELRGVVVDSRNQEVADVETAQAGRGLFSFTPSAGEQYRVRILTPAGIADEPPLPEVSDDVKALLTTGPGVFPASRPLELEIDSLRGGLPLVVAAACRGMLVGQQALVTSDTEQRNRVSLMPTPLACGVIRLSVYEYRAERPRLVAERLVYRQPEQQLQIAIRDGQRPHALGQPLRLALHTTNEKGEPLSAVLGIVATPHDQAAASGLSLPEDFYADGQLGTSARLGDLNALLTADAKAALGLDLLLGTQAPRILPGAEVLAAADGVAPPAVLDNLGALREEYETNLAAYRAERTKALNTLTTLSFFGGFGLVLLVAMLATLKIISGIRLWVPAFAAASVCLVVGATLMNPDRFQPGLGAAVAYVPYHGPRELALGAKAEQADAPAFAAEKWRQTPAEPKSLSVADEAAAAAPAAPPPAAEKPRAAELRQQEVEKAEEGAVSPREAVSRMLQQGFDKMGKRVYAGAEIRSPTLAPPRPARLAAAAREAGATDVVWRPAVKTDAQGRAEFQVPLPAAGAYRVRAEGHAPGRLGAAEQVFQAQVPCQLEPKLPTALTLGDQWELPLVISNPTNTAAMVEVTFKHGPQLRLKDASARRLELKSGESRRELYHLEATALGECTLAFRAQTGQHVQSVDRSLAVVARGYPSCRVYAGRLRGEQLLTVDLPAWQAGSLAVELTALPTLLAELERAYAAVDGGPDVCVEQPAAAAWLAALALEQIQRGEVVWPEVVRRWRDRLDASLARLAPYEAAPRGSGGYAWFAADPGQEAPSALVLAALEEVNRAAGLNVGRGPISAWLRARLDAKGALRQNPKSPPVGLTPELLVASMTWSLARHDPKELETMLKQNAASAHKAENLWQVALAADTLLAANLKSEALPLVDRLASAQRGDGRVPGTPAVQTTALAASIWWQTGRRLPAEKALGWLCTMRQGDGGFGPPHATALVLRAMAAQSQDRGAEVLSGKLSLRAGTTLLAEQPVGTAEQQPLAIADAERRFRPGKNPLSLSLAAVGTMDYLLRFRLATDKPEAGAGPLLLVTRLESPLVRREKTVGLTLEVANSDAQAVLLPVVVLGLPAGLEPRVEQLQQLKKLGTIDQFTLDGRQLTLAWSSFEGRKRLALRVELAAVAAGRFQGPPSFAYLYHTPDAQRFAAPLSVEIAP
jgi:hypothetical protein